MSKETKSKNFKIAYVSDIHLETKIDFLQDIVNNISQELKTNNFDILLIGGDTSNELEIFKTFICALKKSISNLQINTKIIFVLGNHELWESAQTLNEIIDKYKKVIIGNKMFFIQNSILYLDSNMKNCSFKEITELELSKISINSLRVKLQKSNLIIFGGIGFSGYNSANDIFSDIYSLSGKSGEFMLENYGKTINHKNLVEETKKFEQLYNKICDSIYDKTPIIFTHTPIEFWCKNNRNIDNFKYVNGHTHGNNYHKNISNIYSNNQIGYKNHSFYLKYFETKKKKSFLDFKDGIHEIKINDYIEFYRNNMSINISINEKKFKGKFYVLKKKKYLCFVYKKTDEKLSLLFGGKVGEILLSKDIKYYYNNMKQNIGYLKSIKGNLKEYKNFQKIILKLIEDSGFSESYIDGTKIYINSDFDSASIIFINPADFSIMPYYSKNRQRTFYPNIETLLKKHFPKHYAYYIKQRSFIKNYKHKKITELEKNYFYYDINTKDNNDIVNKISKKIKRLYALNKNIICTWYETSK